MNLAGLRWVMVRGGMFYSAAVRLAGELAGAGFQVTIQPVHRDAWCVYARGRA